MPVNPLGSRLAACSDCGPPNIGLPGWWVDALCGGPSGPLDSPGWAGCNGGHAAGPAGEA